MLIKVKSGLVIRDPATRTFVPPEGLEVPDDNLFWQRRLRDGDVELVNSETRAKSRQKTSLLGSDE